MNEKTSHKAFGREQQLAGRRTPRYSSDFKIKQGGTFLKERVPRMGAPPTKLRVDDGCEWAAAGASLPCCGTLMLRPRNTNEETVRPCTVWTLSPLKEVPSLSSAVPRREFPSEDEEAKTGPREAGSPPFQQCKQCCRLDSQEDSKKKSMSSPPDFSDPVYKEISLTNGYINRMSRDQLRAKLEEFKLDTRGVKDVLKKRLKNYYKKEKLMQKQPMNADNYYDYICVIDFEATCEEGNQLEVTHEIIEFPIVLLNTRTLEIEDTFQKYVRPEINPQLSDFCINLTGISQDLVDKADEFPRVLQCAVDWMKQKGLGSKYSYCILTDGSWDMSKFLNIQCRVSRLKYPSFAKKWINIRKSYGNFYKVPRNQTKLSAMLEKLGMDYDGRPHSGLDDSKNIARIAVRMLQDGCELRVNEKLYDGVLLTVSSSTPIEGAPVPQMPRFR